MARGFPDFVFNSPQDEPVLRQVFSYEAQVYDLAAYENIRPGFGKRIWDLIEAERAHQKCLAEHPQYNPAQYGYKIR